MIGPFITTVKTDLDNVLQMTQMINGIMMTGDSAANQIIVELYHGRTKQAIEAGTRVVGYFIRGDGFTLETLGEVTQTGEASVIIPPEAYEVPGALSIAVRLMYNPEEVTPEEGEPYINWRTRIVIAALSCFVQNTDTDSIIDVDHHYKILDVQALLAYLDLLDEQYRQIGQAEAERVLAEAQRETDTASAIQDVEDSIVNMQSAIAETMNDAIDDMQDATSDMEDAVQEVIDKIDDMTVSAVGRQYNEPPTVAISEVEGHKHITFGLVPGQPFRIQKTFASIAEMEAYSGSDIHVGDMVIIVNTVEDPDNAKLFVKTNSGWSYIVDLSGATGIQGPKGDTGDIGPGIDHVVMNADYTLTIYLENGTSYTTPYPLRGEKGEPGTGGTNFVYDTLEETLSIGFY